MNTKEKELWNEVRGFQLDSLEEEYGFSIKLSYENNWSVQFTEDAILEYKKFMFLVAVTKSMVSPSHIIDIVWHLHLTFSESYQDFCEILGKNVKHIPSTGKKGEKAVLSNAVNFTAEKYENYFGTRNEVIWTTKSFENEVKVNEANAILKQLTNNHFLFFGALLSVPFFFLWKPILLKIGNPDFIFLAIGFFVITFGTIELLIGHSFKKAFKVLIDQNFYIKKLRKEESFQVIETKIDKLILYKINNLFESDHIDILEGSSSSIGFLKEELTEDVYENTVLNYMEESPGDSLKTIIEELKNKPIFIKLHNVSKLIREKILYSKEVVEYKIVIACMLFFFFSFVFSRFFLGIFRGKPVTIIMFFLVIVGVFSYSYLSKVYTRNFKSNFLPLASLNLETNKYLDNAINNEAIVLAVALSTLVINNKLGKSNYTSSSSNWFGDSSCGTSCSSGSSCSSCSSCGGCGGD